MTRPLSLSKSKKIWTQAFLALLSIFVTPAYALLSNSSYTRTWHPVLALGAGAASTSNLGQSQSFPIQNPTTDEFYYYFANRPTQTSGLFDGFLGTEWRFRPKWALQMGLDYNQASPFSAKGTFQQGADALSADTYSYHYAVLTRQILAEGKLLYTVKCFHPYLFGGLGVAVNSAYNYYTNVPPFLTFTRMYANNTTTSFSYAVGVGVDKDLTSHLRAGVGYRFAGLGRVKLGIPTIDTTRVSGTLSQSHLYANELLAQLTWIV